uniref:Predicted protein n=1 Tax=Physcomitrium patens TaxID=3218 RepID=A9U454_PHYPA
MRAAEFRIVAENALLLSTALLLHLELVPFPHRRWRICSLALLALELFAFYSSGPLVWFSLIFALRQFRRLRLLCKGSPAVVLCLLDYALFALAVGDRSNSLATVLCLRKVDVPSVVESFVLDARSHSTGSIFFTAAGWNWGVAELRSSSADEDRNLQLQKLFPMFGGDR